jgi:hypothetical protein
MHPSQKQNSSRRQLIIAAAATAALGLSGCAPPISLHPPGAAPLLPATARLRLIGEARLPNRMDFQRTTVGGLSGIDYDPASGLYYLISDDGDLPRFYTARLQLDGGQIGELELLRMTILRRTDGSPWPSSLTGKLIDPESMRWRAASRTLLWTIPNAV